MAVTICWREHNNNIANYTTDYWHMLSNQWQLYSWVMKLDYWVRFLFSIFLLNHSIMNEGFHFSDGTYFSGTEGVLIRQHHAATHCSGTKATVRRYFTLNRAWHMETHLTTFGEAVNLVFWRSWVWAGTKTVASVCAALYLCSSVKFSKCREGFTENVHKHSGWFETSGISQFLSFWKCVTAYH